MPGHDQLFKDLLRSFFPDFMALVQSDIASELKLEAAEFQDTEAFTDLPEGEQVSAGKLCGDLYKIRG